MLPGFLGTRASFMLDFVFLAMFAVVPVMAWSIYQVRYRQRYWLHKRVQLALGGVLLVAVALFEIDMRIFGWKHLAAPSTGEPSPTVWTALYIHLLFAVTTSLLWIGVIVAALRHFPAPPAPAAHSRQHRFWGWVAAIDMLLTALTGWIFYWLAFAAPPG